MSIMKNKSRCPLLILIHTDLKIFWISSVLHYVNVLQFFGINTNVVTKLWSFSSILLQYGTSKATVRKDFKILKICEGIRKQGDIELELSFQTFCMLKSEFNINY